MRTLICVVCAAFSRLGAGCAGEVSGQRRVQSPDTSPCPTGHHRLSAHGGHRQFFPADHQAGRCAGRHAGGDKTVVVCLRCYKVRKKEKWQGFISKFLLLLCLLFLLLWSYPWQQLQCVTYGTRKKKGRKKRRKKKKKEVTQSVYHKFNNDNLYSSEIVLFSVNSVSFVLHVN